MDTDKRIIVFAPHPDDETLGCGGTIAKKISEGYEVIVVMMTGGESAFLRILGIESDPTPEELKQIRKEEIVKATKILGLPYKNLLFLDFEDGALREREKEASEKIIKILKKYPPDEVYYPYNKDYNPDHQATNRIVKTCLQELGLTPVKYQYSIAQKFSRIGPLIARLLAPLKKNIFDVDISDFLHIKRQAIWEFKSQTSMISSKQREPLVEKTNKFLKNKEVFYVDE